MKKTFVTLRDIKLTGATEELLNELRSLRNDSTDYPEVNISEIPIDLLKKIFYQIEKEYDKKDINELYNF